MNTTRTLTRIGMVVAAGALWASLVPAGAFAATADTAADTTRSRAASAAVKATGAGSEATADAAGTGQDAVESTWAFGFVFDSAETGIGVIYYTAPYFDLKDIVNPATGEAYTAAEIESILAGANADDAADQGYVTAPKDALLGMAVYDGDETYWYDANAAEAIISFDKALTLDTKTGELVDADGNVVAKPMAVETAVYADGTYEATAKGMGGNVPVTVTVKDGKILSVEVGDNAETQGIGSKAIEQLPDRIVEANGIDGVDAISGASVTSKAIFDAVQSALDQAKVVEGADTADGTDQGASTTGDAAASDKDGASTTDAPAKSDKTGGASDTVKPDKDDGKK